MFTSQFRRLHYWLSHFATLAIGTHARFVTVAHPCYQGFRVWQKVSAGPLLTLVTLCQSSRQVFSELGNRPLLSHRIHCKHKILLNRYSLRVRYLACRLRQHLDRQLNCCAVTGVAFISITMYIEAHPAAKHTSYARAFHYASCVRIKVAIVVFFGHLPPCFRQSAALLSLSITRSSITLLILQFCFTATAWVILQLLRPLWLYHPTHSLLRLDGESYRKIFVESCLLSISALYAWATPGVNS